MSRVSPELLAFHGGSTEYLGNGSTWHEDDPLYYVSDDLFDTSNRRPGERAALYGVLRTIIPYPFGRRIRDR